MKHRAIFHDPTGRRARQLTWAAWLALGFVATVLAAFFTNLALTGPPRSTDLDSTAEALFLAPATAAVNAPRLIKSSERLAAELRAKERKLARAPHVKAGRPTRPHEIPSALRGVPGRGLSIAFYVNWDDSSYPALERALPQLDWVVPGWLNLQGPDMALQTSVDNKAAELIASVRPGIPVLPMIQNAVEGQWDGPGLAKLLADPTKRAARLKEIVDFLAIHGMQGLTVDFETVPESAHKDLQAFLKEMAAAFAPHGWVIALAVPFDDDGWDYVAYADIVDFIVLMAYDEHWEEGTAGSIASQGWYEKILDKRMQQLDPDHTIVAIGNYGYDWAGKKTAEDVTFQEAVRAAQASGSTIDFDAEAENPHFSFVEDGGKHHDVWFLDGVTAYNQIHAADVFEPVGYALWRLGSEDPSIWSVMGRPYNAAAPDGLRTIPKGRDVVFDGTGEILRVASKPAAGRRDIEIDPETGDIVDQNYSVVPTSYVIKRFGAVPKKIALTFDDGPDPIWTPQILDILKDKHVRASFFVIGENAGAYPDLVRRTFAEQHDVGNHTFTHPNLAILPGSMVKLEINTTRRLFEALTGHSMRLFRPPYFGDAEPTTLDEIVPVELAQEMGFVTVGLQVDPDDWQRPSADTIVTRVMDQIADPNLANRGQIVLLHDAGGNRAATVAALPQLIDRLRQAGYEIVPVSELAGLSHEQAMPVVVGNPVAPLVDWSVFRTMGWLNHTLRGLFLAAIWLGVARLLFLSVFALLHVRKDRRAAARESVAGTALISVLIPARNEERVIAASIDRILQSGYPSLEVIVVDDGSTDRTSATVASKFGAAHNVRLISTANGGKAAALNRALAEAKGVIVVAMDADTQFEPDTIARLAAHFSDPSIGAVAGNAKVGNRVNTVTRWQALEYISAQNLERRALAALGCITVVPGAVGAWRRDVLLRLGGFPVDTLAEDQDLTIGVQKAGFRVVYESRAIAWTEAPDTISGLAKQRFRWAYGTLQCLWKHRDMLFRPRFGTLGLIGLPQVWLFQVFLALLAPLVDLALIWQIARAGLDYLQHREQFDPDNLIITALYFMTLLAADLAAVSLAFMIERNENWRLTVWLVLQRFGYRQILYYVVVKSFVAAIAGRLVGWGRLDRKATVAVGAH